MAAEAFFLKKRARPGAVRGGRGGAARPTGAARGGAPAPAPRPKAAPRPKVINPPPAAAKPDPKDLLEFQIVSAGDDVSGLRFNMMKMNTSREVDPADLPRPILMNRKQPGPRQPPQFATDAEGKIVGRYVYDEEGKPVLDEEGKPKIEKKTEMDMSLVGTAPGTSNKRRGKRQTKEVFHQDVDVIRLRREEMNPWILESKDKTPEDAPGTSKKMASHWVGRLVEQTALPTVLLVNNGSEANFTMIPLGRTYRFDPERPFKVMEADEANKYFEHQAKYKVHDRWGVRQEGGSGTSTPARSGRMEPHHLERRAMQMEQGIMARKGQLPSAFPKREKFEDDYARENRNIGRGLEGGEDEELDYDVDELFADDEDSNTFYHNKEEDEEKKLQESKQKREYRLANFNVGDKPQLEDDEDEGDDDDFDQPGGKLTSEGKRLRKMMRRRGGEDDDLYESTDDESDSSDEEEQQENKEKDEKEKRPPGSAEKSRPASRAGSRGPDARGASPSRKGHSGTPERTVRGPGAGQALLAKRAASRGVSPRPGSSRAGSPLARGSSPDGGRGASPGVGRAGSPVLPRGSSPAPGATRQGTPGAVDPARRQKPSKRKATDSPGTDGSGFRSGANKRKSPEDTPTPPAGSGGSPAPNKRPRGKQGSGTPDLANESFPDMITREEVLQWLKQQPGPFPMLKAVEAFMKKIKSAKDEYHRDRQQKRLLQYMRALTDKLPQKMMQLKEELR